MTDTGGISRHLTLVRLTVLAVLVFLVASFAVTRPPWSVGVQISDVPDYQRYGEAVLAGGVPYRDVRIEYPPGALAAFVPPAIAGDGQDAYARAFAWLMRLFGVVLVVSVAIALRALGVGRARAAFGLALVALSPVLLGRVVLQRFDLLPAALTALAFALLLTRHDRLAFAALALGTGTKLYPAVLLPIFLAWVWRRSGSRGALACVGVFTGVLAAMIVPFALVGTGGLQDAFVQQADRPLHRESTGAAILLALHHVAGLDLQTVRSHGSTNFAGSAADLLASLSVIVQLGVLATIWVLAVRLRMTSDQLVRLSAAAVVAFVVLGKVLSPQFLIWPLALVPLVAGRRGVAAAALLASALVVTQAYFPRRYLALAELAAAPSWLIVTRDTLLVVLLGVLLWKRRSGGIPGATPTDGVTRRRRRDRSGATTAATRR